MSVIKTGCTSGVSQVISIYTEETLCIVNSLKADDHALLALTITRFHQEVNKVSFIATMKPIRSGFLKIWTAKFTQKSNQVLWTRDDLTIGRAHV